jgi:hypothetical protein
MKGFESRGKTNPGPLRSPVDKGLKKRKYFTKSFDNSMKD